MNPLKIGILGTTSCGKSTLANLLIGQNLLPSAVQEMTKCSTWIRHASTKSLYLDEQLIELHDEPAPSIQQTLTQWMTQAENKTARINWPTRLGKWSNDTSLTLVDVPGFKFVGDQHNLSFLPENLDLALVVFGADETDTQKQRVFMEHVHQRLPNTKKIFVLNKIDLLLKDNDPKKSEARLLKQLYKLITPTYPNHVIMPINALAAHHALMIQDIGKHHSNWLNRKHQLANQYTLFQRIFSLPSITDAEKRGLQSLEKEMLLAFDHENFSKLPRSLAKWPFASRTQLLHQIVEETRFLPLKQTLIKTIHTST